MHLAIERKTNDKVLELGGGDQPMVHPKCMGGNDINVDVRQCQNAQGQQTVDFTANFDEPLPIQSDEWDIVVSKFSFEHVSWRVVPQFLKEVYRIIKPGGKLYFIVPNTEAQIKYIITHPSGWDGRDAFTSCSCILFGDLNYSDNSHKSFWSPGVSIPLLQQTGFQSIVVSPFGNLATDMEVQATKPLDVQVNNPAQELLDKDGKVIVATPDSKLESPEKSISEPTPVVGQSVLTAKSDDFRPMPPMGPGSLSFPPNIEATQFRSKERPTSRLQELSKTYGLKYFDNYRGTGFLWNYPYNEIITNKVLERQPKSVLELGCGRGYILKRLQDNGVLAAGMDASKHAFMTRATEGILHRDVAEVPWPMNTDTFDLCLSVNFLEHLKGELIPSVAGEMARCCKRGLHGITLEDDGADPSRRTVRPREWWKSNLPGGHEVLDARELAAGDLSESFVKGDGKLKVNLGCAWTMFYGWVNMDVLDLKQFAQVHNYNFQQRDIRYGLPWGTGVVDLIYLGHVLEHFTYSEGLALLRELRRVIRPEGALRILVPDAALLTRLYVGGDSKLGSLSDFDDVNIGCLESPTAAGKLWALLHHGHQSCYDVDTLSLALQEANFEPKPTTFRQTQVGAVQEILRGSLDTHPALTLYMDAVPMLG